MDNKNYQQRCVFTSSARDVVEMHGETLSQFNPILVKGYSTSSGDPLKDSDRALERLVTQAQVLGCKYVVDVEMAMVKYLNPSVQYIGTGLIPKNPTIVGEGVKEDGY